MITEVPDSIYIFDNPILDFTKLSVRQSDNDIEYVRTDALIEKACVWLEPILKDLAGYYSGADLLNDFKNYMKGDD